MYTKTTRITDENGEVISDKSIKYDGGFSYEKGYMLYPKRFSVKSFTDLEFPSELTDSELGKILRLTKKVYGKTNMLGYRGNRGVIKPYSDEQLSEYLGLQLRQWRKFINKVVEVGVIVKHTENKVVSYYFNPIYFFSNNRVSLSLYLICKDKLDKFITQWAKDKFKTQIDAMEEE